jgi:hypothetical protein
MAEQRFSPPQQWEDWLSWGLGIWLAISPWALQFAADTAATRNALAVGALLVAVEAAALTVFRTWEEWINVALGAWLILSPWILGVTAAAAHANFIVVGVLVVGLALHELWEVRRNPPQRT